MCPPVEVLRSALARALTTVRTAPVGFVVGTLGLTAALLLVITEFSTIVSVDVLTAGTCEEIADPRARDACQVSGLEQHGGAFFLIAVVILLMALGAARGASRPAAVALVALGAIVLVVTGVRDLPKLHETGLVGIEYEKAQAGPSTGFYLEIVAGFLCIGAGLVRLLFPEEPDRRRPRGSRRDQRTAAG